MLNPFFDKLPQTPIEPLGFAQRRVLPVKHDPAKALGMHFCAGGYLIPGEAGIVEFLNVFPQRIQDWRVRLQIVGFLLRLWHRFAGLCHCN